MNTENDGKFRENPAVLSMAQIQKKLFAKDEEEDEPVIDENSEHPLPNLTEIFYQFEKAGVGLCNNEATQLYLAIKALVNVHPVKIARFWGKIFGVMQNYYILETEFIEGEETEEEDEEAVNNDENNTELEDAEDEEGETKDALPKSKWKSPPKVPREGNNMGVNKKVYFVCHEPGLQWMRLPAVTPEQIVAARSICTIFTGNLDAHVNCSPPFPGTEANYLRAQIARISASTQISPEGFYHVGDGGEEEEEEMNDEEGGERQRYSKNEDYEALPIKELVNSNVENWVHHMSYILPQGRVVWWNPTQNVDEELDEFNVDEDGENEQADKVAAQPERGPPILTKISTDVPIFGQPAWSTRLTSKLIPEHAVALVSSNLWIGAHTVAWGKQFENIYIGWGQKSVGPGYQAYLPPDVLCEYTDAPDVTEAVDPTAEDEAALRKVQNPEAGEEEEGADDTEAGEDGAEEDD
ncbi:radial spoke head protein 4A [Paragonimus westermani]|uniref:Radial spoke head protein 4A n=1 Tax=Paragonimus westermani TaxID=34504 RepID=A0A5J4NYW8_9TREM|nr:radial spoke head protein 4A [Paragonimus westermani]